MAGLAARRLGDERDIGEHRVGQQFTERRDADRAFADRLVPVAPRSAGEQRVVRVHQSHAARPGGALDLVKRGGHAIGRGEVVPGSEQVTRVQADADFGMRFERREVRRQVGRASAQHVALPGHRLEQQVRVIVAELVEQRQQQRADLPQRLIGVLPHRRTRVHHYAPRPDLAATVQRVLECRRGAAGDHVVGRAQIDQVRRMDIYRYFGLAEPSVLVSVAPARRPATGVGDEELDGFGADGRGVLKPARGQPAGNGRVRPDKRHGGRV